MITGSGNAQLKMIRQLMKSREMREERGVFAAEGRKIFEEVPENAVEQIYVSGTFAREHAGELADRTYTVVEDKRFESISDTKNPQGVIAVLKKPVWNPEEVLSPKAEAGEGKKMHGLLLLMAEHLQDPGNAGTIIRTAEAAGADAVIFTDDSVDIFNPKVVRATMGSIFRVPVLYVNDAAAFAGQLKERKIRTYAAYLPGSTVYDEPDYTGGTCFIIGNESKGLSLRTAEAADARIRIPMTEHINSLNAAMAAGILLYEAERQRRKS
ncbi:MAG: RNA methyltransferase [Lachnospiraceae bacterium]|nr:RNA methyltransferase [Lachnospiraceae bacterium]